MKLENVVNEEYYGILSSKEQDTRLNKMFEATGDEGLKLLFMWVKQNIVSFREFKELTRFYFKE